MQTAWKATTMIRCSRSRSFRYCPSGVTESLNQLRVNLGFCGSDIKTIMVTSSTPDEGKSFVSMNLWRMMAETGARTLLIDADLRNSEMRTGIRYRMRRKAEGYCILSGRQDQPGECHLQNQYPKWIYDSHGFRNRQSFHPAGKQ